MIIPAQSIQSILADLERRLAALETRLDLVPSHPAVEAADGASILRTVCNYYGVLEEKLISPARDYEIAWPRQVCMFLLRHRTLLSYFKIGRLLHRDHGTVLWGCRVVQDRMRNDPSIKAQVDYLLAITARPLPDSSHSQSQIPNPQFEISNVKCEIHSLSTLHS